MEISAKTGSCRQGAEPNHIANGRGRLYQRESSRYIGLVRQFCHRAFHDAHVSVHRAMQTAAMPNESANRTFEGLRGGREASPDYDRPERAGETEEDY